MSRGTKWLSFVALLLAGSVALFFLVPPGAVRRNAANEGRYLTQLADTGSIERVVSATGTLNPVFRVTVGSQASGTISEVRVDFNDAVRKGQLLASIYPESLLAQVSQVRAQIDSAKASLQLAQSTAQRSRTLFSQGYIAQSEMDEAIQGELSARATLMQQQASLRKEQAALGNTRIVSPIDGVVVTRDVSVGQTVAASFQTPSLFTLAQNLRDMQIDTSVSEADVGMVREGQRATFTVDAFPGEVFEGVVQQIRNNYTVVQNVVTYNVVVRANNPGERLRPGMTSYVSIAVQQISNALRVPNAALRFRPPQASPVAAGNLVVYRLRGSALEAVNFTTGVSNAIHTEALNSTLMPGDLLVVGESTKDTQAVPPGMRLF